MSSSYEPRTYRVVRLCVDDRCVWLVVSSSWRDDDTWDVIRQCPTAGDGFAYIAEVIERNRALALELGCRA